MPPKVAFSSTKFLCIDSFEPIPRMVDLSFTKFHASTSWNLAPVIRTFSRLLSLHAFFLILFSLFIFFYISSSWCPCFLISRRYKVLLAGHTYLYLSSQYPFILHLLIYHQAFLVLVNDIITIFYLIKCYSKISNWNFQYYLSAMRIAIITRAVISQFFEIKY